MQNEVSPEEAGFDPQRLRRIDNCLAEYVHTGRLPGWSLLISRGGQVVHRSTCGQQDMASATPVRQDALFRIYSMTKPVTSIAAMILHERGVFELTDPIANFLPAFAEPRVYTGGTPDAPQTRPATEPIRIWHLLTHTAGLTYGFHHVHPVDAMYRAAGFDMNMGRGMDLAGCCEAWSDLPLLFDPGRRWNYSVATDVLGHLVEVAAGQPLDAFLQEQLFTPLGMHDTGFRVDRAEQHRLATLYVADADKRATPHPRAQRAHQVAFEQPKALSGGGGLISSAHDYHRFTQMLLRGGALDGVRVLGSRTVRYMASNHLPDRASLHTLALDGFAEPGNVGTGFGLGFSVVDDPVAGKVPCSRGELAWGGMASTAFWVDPAEELSVVFLTQLIPANTHPLQSQLRQLVYQALVD